MGKLVRLTALIGVLVLASGAPALGRGGGGGGGHGGGGGGHFGGGGGLGGGHAAGGPHGGSTESSSCGGFRCRVRSNGAYPPGDLSAGASSAATSTPRGPSYLRCEERYRCEHHDQPHRPECRGTFLHVPLIIACLPRLSPLVGDADQRHCTRARIESPATVSYGPFISRAPVSC